MKGKRIVTAVLAFILLLGMGSMAKGATITLPPVSEEDSSVAQDVRLTPPPVSKAFIEATDALQELSKVWRSWPDLTYPADVGGIAYSQKLEKGVVLLVNNTASRQAQIRRMVSHPNALVFFSCKYSYAQMQAVMDELQGQMLSLGIAGLGIGYSGDNGKLTPGFGESGYENRVCVMAASQQAHDRLSKILPQRYGDMVYLEKATGYMIPKSDDDSAQQAAGASHYPPMQVKSSTLNVRSGPGVDYDVQDQLEKGDGVQVVGQTGNWSQVLYHNGSQLGYVFTKYLKPQGDPHYFATEEVNVRGKANSQSSILGVLVAGESVLYQKKSGSWDQVQYDGQKGYVYGKYLTSDRRECFFTHPVGQMLGKENIQSVDYSYRTAFSDLGEEGLLLSLRYHLRGEDDRAFDVEVCDYQTAQLAQKALQNSSANPDEQRWTMEDTLIIIRCEDSQGMEKNPLYLSLVQNLQKANGVPAQ